MVLRRSLVRLKRLLTGLIGVTGACLVGLPTKAARLQTWQFDADQNRLMFTTDKSVKPQARLVAPNRLVVDLPGIVYEQPTARRQFDGSVRSVVVRQHGAYATRLDIELRTDYPLTPDRIQVWGVTSQQWVIQLPNSGSQAIAESPFPPSLKPLRSPSASPSTQQVQLPTFRKGAGKATGASETASNREASNHQAASNQAAFSQAASGQAGSKEIGSTHPPASATYIQGIVGTPQGFFIQISGALPQVQIYRTRDASHNRQFVIDVFDATLASTFTDVPPSQYLGVQGWGIAQFATSPPAVRLTLSLPVSGSDWQLRPITGGLMLIPTGPSIVASVMRSPPPATMQLSPPPVTQTPPPSAARTLVRAERAPISTQLPHGQRVVALDPGHGGADPGAVGLGGLQEKTVVMNITRSAAAALEAAGVRVVMTRQSDQDVALQPRVDTAEAVQANLFVSIHANAVSSDRPDVNGVETYYYSETGARFATILHAQVIQHMQSADRGVRQARFYVLRRTSMPAALIETGFVTGAIDARNLRDAQWQVRMGEAIAAGIIAYLSQ